MNMPTNKNDDSAFNADLYPNYYTKFAMAFSFLPEMAKGFIMFVKLVFDFFLSMYSLPLEVILRWRWGSRCLSLFQVGWLSMIPVAAALIGDPILGLWLLTAFGFAVWHYIEARRGEFTRNPIRISYSWGESVVWDRLSRYFVEHWHLRPTLFSERMVFRFWEPATGLVLGLVMVFLPFTQIAGGSLIASGLALLLKRHLLHLRFIDQERDRLDAIEYGRLLSQGGNAKSIKDERATFVVQLAVPSAFQPFEEAAPPSVTSKQQAPAFLDLPKPDIDTAWPPPLKELQKEVQSSASPAKPKAKAVNNSLPTRFEVACPGCQRKTRCDSSMTGRKAKCSRCEARFVIAPAS